MGGAKTKQKMKLIPAIALLAIVLTPLTGQAQGAKDCGPSSPSASAAYQSFMRSDLPAQWSTKDFGPLAPLKGGDFLDCVHKGGYISFAMTQSNMGNTARTLGYATKSGLGKAVVFEVTQTGAKSYIAKAMDVAGNALFNITVVDGNVVDVQGLRTGCSGIYLRNFASVCLATAGTGPVGFGVSMAVMVFDLWDNGCI